MTLILRAIVFTVIFLLVAGSVYRLVLLTKRFIKALRPNAKGSDPVEIVEAGLKVLAILAAGSFFLYKIFAGWLVMNMTVAIRTERVSAGGSNDHLAVYVVLDKGSTDSVWLNDIQVRIKQLPGGTSKELDVPVSGFDRMQEDKDNGKNKVRWKEREKGTPLAISPGEKMEFAGYSLVPKGKPMFVEAVVLGGRTLSSIWDGYPSQWHVSAISLPVVIETEPPSAGSKPSL